MFQIVDSDKYFITREAAERHAAGLAIRELTRADLAQLANDLAQLSRRGGAPTLAIDSLPETIAEWCQWDDPNGTYTAALIEADSGWGPMDADEAWGCLENLIQDAVGANE